MPEGTYDSDLAHALDLRQLKAIFLGKGCKNIFVKKLAYNDNSKNQIYVAGSFGELAEIPLGEWRRRASESRKERINKSSVLLQNQIVFLWITPDGSERRAAGAKLIYYPQYPEVRFSGFLQGCGINASEWMQPEKKGRSEGRFLVWGINPEFGSFGYLAVPGTQLARELQPFVEEDSGDSKGVLRPLNRSSKGANKKALIFKLREIIANNPHFGQKLDVGTGLPSPYSAQNAGGMTLESLFGISPNGDAKPDFNGWELKGHCQPVITLLTPEPDGGVYVQDGPEHFVLKYGYPDKSGKPSRINFGGVHKNREVHKTTGLRLMLEGVSFDDAATKIESDGFLGLIDANGVVTASWSFEKLLNHWNTKHSNTAFIRYQKLKDVTPNCFSYLTPVHLGEGTSFERFLRSLDQGVIYYDPGIKLQTDQPKNRLKRRSQFRINERNLQNLYESFSQVEIITSC